MNLKKPLEIDTYWNSPEFEEMRELGIDCEYIPVFKKITFYTVDHIFSCESKNEPIEKGYIMSGGEQYRTVLTYQELKALIDKNI